MNSVRPDKNACLRFQDHAFDRLSQTRSLVSVYITKEEGMYQILLQFVAVVPDDISWSVSRSVGLSFLFIEIKI